MDNASLLVLLFAFLVMAPNMLDLIRALVAYLDRK